MQGEKGDSVGVLCNYLNVMTVIENYINIYIYIYVASVQLMVSAVQRELDAWQPILRSAMKDL